MHLAGLLCAFLCTEGNKLYPDFSSTGDGFA